MRKIGINYFYKLISDSNGKFTIEDSEEFGYVGEVVRVVLVKDNTGDVIDWLYPNKYNQVTLSDDTLVALLMA